MRLSKVSQILGRGWESFFVREFNLLKSIQNLKEPSFFQTSTTALHQGLLLSQIAPASSINLRCSLTSSTCGGGILLNWGGIRIFELDNMLCSFCTSDLVLFQGEQVMVLRKEASRLFGCFCIPSLQSRQI